MQKKRKIVKNTKTCFMCEKKIKPWRMYCYDHYQEYLAVKEEQMWSVDDDDSPQDFN